MDAPNGYSPAQARGTVTPVMSRGIREHCDELNSIVRENEYLD